MSCRLANAKRPLSSATSLHAGLRRICRSRLNLRESGGLPTASCLVARGMSDPIHLWSTKRPTNTLLQISLDPDMAETMERLQGHLKSLKDNANEAEALSDAIVDARAMMDDVLRSKLPSEYDNLTVL